ncbi:hypothetical protein CJ030_MR2G006026 [Morella rubra]|uniref:Uncharacterized protein n=1 Tax=Morella rubra TaxID=262757 RepID=A0A6A1WD88_9ROSI|nr:hypothetical protein CJ030_MR2G006026 [Morella rubra]
MGRDRHAWEDRCQDEAALAPMGTLDTPTARAARAPQPCHGISARAQAQRPINPDKAWRPSNTHAWHAASQPQACHDSPHGLVAMTRCHSKSLATSQAKQASGPADKGVPYTRMATTSGGAPPPLPVLGGERKRKGHRVEGAPPPMEVQAAAAPPWTRQGPRGFPSIAMEAVSSSLTSNRDRFEALESSTLWLKDKMEETSTTMAHMQGAITTVTMATEENRRAVEGMRQDLQAVLARLGGEPREGNHVQAARMEENRREDVHLEDGRETHLSESTREEPRPRQPLRMGGRVENEHEVVERWLREESNRGDDDHARSEDGVGGSRYREERSYGRTYDDARRRDRPRKIVTTIVMRGMVMGIGITTEDLEGKTIIEVIMMKMVEMEIGFTTEDLGDRR